MVEWDSSETLREGGRIAAAFAVGAAAGTVAMWLLSPRTGFENRMKLRSALRSGRDRAAAMPKRVASASEAAREKAGRSFNRIQEQLR